MGNKPGECKINTKSNCIQRTRPRYGINSPHNGVCSRFGLGRILFGVGEELSVPLAEESTNDLLAVPETRLKKLDVLLEVLLIFYPRLIPSLLKTLILRKSETSLIQPAM